MSATQRINGTVLALAALVLSATAQPAPQEAPPPAADTFFTERVLPILTATCFKCHGPDLPKVRSGLRMNSLDALLKGGDRGPALVPGNTAASLLVTAIRWSDPDLQMPPKRKLSFENRLVLEQWIATGAHWPEGIALPASPEDATAEDALVDPAAEVADAAAAADAAADATAAAAASAPAEPALSEHDAALFFEQEVRPVLADNCFKCHGPDLEKVKSGLRMSGRDALLAGGDRGPAIVPADVEGSLLIHAVRYADADLSMPPDGRLGDADVATLERWVALGAPWPAPPDAVATAAASSDTEPPPPARAIDYAAGRTWWSFRPVVRPVVPAARDDAPADATRAPIDAFVDARLEAAGLTANDRASREELARRAWFDLVGLPPSAEEVQRFVADDAPDAWPRLIDRLLAMPQYGERWGRHWLDVVRFAQTNGYERDEEKPEAWRYRDWVIRAFNEDLPYDEFVKEQVAGDELEPVTADGQVATGFYRVGVWDDEPDDVEQAAFDDLDDVVRTIGEGFLGVTIGCARCHDHKFDPFGQEDYYATLALVRNVRRYAVPEYSTASPELMPLADDETAFVAWEADRARTIRDLTQQKDAILHEGRALAVAPQLDCVPANALAAWRMPAALRTLEQDSLVSSAQELHPDQSVIVAALPSADARRLFELGKAVEDTRTSFKGSIPWALAVKEAGTEAPPTHVMIRGKASAPAAEVPPRFIRVLCPDDEAAVPQIVPAARSTGRRRALAEWIASPANPLTARVMVNRLWQHHFGRGLVDTPSDFGATGSAPSDPELLDWLAAEFVAQGWSIKAMQRQIMLSDTYQRSSRADDAAALAADPDNRLLWRQELRRLDAEALRDAVLAAAGTLDLEAGGRGFFPRLSREALAGGSRPGEGWEISSSEQQQRRSVYAYIKRSLLVPLLEAFDYTSTSLPVAARTTTTIASQALTLLNGEFMNEQAAAFAERVARQAGDDPGAQVQAAFRLALSRDPTEAERALALAELARQTAAFADVKPLLTFRARVPSRVDESFLRRLQGSDILHGPASGWRFLRGAWGVPYNRTRTIDPLAGPAALLDGPPLADGTVSARLLLRGGCEFGSLCLRATEHGDVLTGLELRLLPASGNSPGHALLLLHRDDDRSPAPASGVAATPSAAAILSVQAAPDVLAQADVPLAPDTWHSVRVELQGPRAQVFVDGGAAPLLDVTEPVLPRSGALGIRTWGEALQLDDVSVSAGGVVTAIAPEDGGPPARRALESLCLTLLNLDEFVTVD